MNLLAPGNYEMAYLSGTLRERLLKNGAKITEEMSLHLFHNNKLMTNFKDKIGLFSEKHK